MERIVDKQNMGALLAMARQATEMAMMHIIGGIALAMLSFFWLLGWSLVSTSPIAPSKMDLLPASIGIIGSLTLIVLALALI